VILLCGNKADMESQRQVPREMAEAYAKEEGLLFAEASAKSGKGVSELFIELGECFVFFSYRCAVLGGPEEDQGDEEIQKTRRRKLESSHNFFFFPFRSRSQPRTSPPPLPKQVSLARLELLPEELICRVVLEGRTVRLGVLVETLPLSSLLTYPHVSFRSISLFLLPNMLTNLVSTIY